MTTVAEAITYQRAIHAQEQQIDALHRQIAALRRENRDLRQARLAEMPAGELERMLYPMEGRS